MKKIKIFLGAYVNFPNAQNINCDNIAKYIDKSRFEVHTMYTHKMKIDKDAYARLGVHLHKLIYHRFIWWWCKYLTMLFGNYDIYYLPKMETVDIRFAKRHGRKLFISSVEGVVGEQIPENDPVAVPYYNELMDNYFSISECIQHSVKKYWDMETIVLHLGMNVPIGSPRKREQIRTVIWIGSVIDRKRPQWFLECAKAFPFLQFVMIGDGDKWTEIQNTIQIYDITNISCMGRIPNDKVYDELQKADLLLMTSDKEGLPKVIGEAMISGVPVIYINECYYVDYVEDGVNGYAVPSLETMIEKMQYLIDNPQKYQRMSENAYQMIQNYTWSKLINKYEDYFMEQYERKREKKLKGR